MNAVGHRSTPCSGPREHPVCPGPLAQHGFHPSSALEVSDRPTCAPCRSSSFAVLFISARSSSLSTARFSPPPGSPPAPPVAPSEAAASPAALEPPPAGEGAADPPPEAAAVGYSPAGAPTRANACRVSMASSLLPQASNTCAAGPSLEGLGAVEPWQAVRTRQQRLPQTGKRVEA